MCSSVVSTPNEVCQVQQLLLLRVRSSRFTKPSLQERTRSATNCCLSQKERRLPGTTNQSSQLSTQKRLLSKLRLILLTAEEEVWHQHLLDHHSVPLLHTALELSKDHQPPAGWQFLQMRLQMHLVLCLDPHTRWLLCPSPLQAVHPWFPCSWCHCELCSLIQHV